MNETQEKTMHPGEDTIALVTGAGSGPGLAFCRALLRRGVTLLAVDRCPAQELEARLGEEVAQVLCADLTTVEGLTRVLEAIRQKGPVDLLVNAAGRDLAGGFLEQAPGAQRAFLELHCAATPALCRAALAFMRERGRGRIINPVPAAGEGSAVEAAAGAFLLRFSQQLDREFEACGVRVQAPCAGPGEEALAASVEASLVSALGE